MKQGLLYTLAGFLCCCSAVGADEVKLLNGDVIHGRILSLQGQVLTIDTEGRGGVDIDWAQVAELKSDTALQVRLMDGQQLEGTVALTNVEGPDDTLSVDGNVHEVDSSCVLTIGEDVCPCPEPCCEVEHKWKGKASIGFTDFEGNSDADSWEGEIKATRETLCGDETLYKLSLKGDFKYREQNDRVTVRKGKFEPIFEYFLTHCHTLRLSEEMRWDRGERLDIAFESTVALGYYLWKDDPFTLEVYAGISHFDANYSSAQPDEHYFAIDSGCDVTWKFYPKWTLEHEFEYYPKIDDFSTYWLESDLILSYAIADNWELSAEHDWIYDSKPGTGIGHWDRTLELKLSYCF